MTEIENAREKKGENFIWGDIFNFVEQFQSDVKLSNVFVKKAWLIKMSGL